MAAAPRSIAIKMVGHKTQAIYQRYAIADVSMLNDAAEKLEQLHSVDGESINRRVSVTS